MIAAIPQWSGAQLSGNWDVIAHYALAHLRITVVSLVLGIVVSVPLGLAAHRQRLLYAPVLAATNALYSVPSLSLILLLSAPLGLLNDRPLIAALATYTLCILVRNIVEGLRAVPPDVIDASRAMGFTSFGRLVHVEVPLAFPAIAAGLRVAAVSTISLVSVAGVIGRGGLGFLMTQGFQKDNPWEIWTAVVGSVALAVVVDAVIATGAHLATPWRRAGVHRG